MDTDAHTEGETTAMPAGLRGLWREACGWVAWLTGMFDRNHLKTTGVNRSHGARLSLWLLNIEGAVRRLVLAAALAFTPPAPRRVAACAAARTQPAATPARRHGFCIFRLCGAGQAPHAACPSARQPKPYGHIPFPADPLLNLGAAPARPLAHPMRADHASRARNPLDRWGRLSRQDPDWRPSETEALPIWSDPAPRAQQGAPRQRTAHPPHDPHAIPESLRDWRRHHDAWQKPVPAPDLAARLDALAHVIANPATLIARAARRLRDARDAILELARAANTIPGPPQRAAHLATMGHTEAFAQRCHDACLGPDTS